MQTKHTSLRTALLPAVALALSLGAAGCGDDDDNPAAPSPEPVTFDFDLTAGAEDWRHGFADVPVEDTGNYELTYEASHPLPGDLGLEGSAPFLAGSNLSDDLFMYLFRRVDGLAPSSRYRVDFELEIATDALADAVGIGGPPGEAVYVKAGATPVEPALEVLPVGDVDYNRINIDKGNQSQGGRDAVVIGNVARDDGAESGWDRKTLTSDASADLTVRTDGQGSAWLLVGTDSGFEGRTDLYYLRVRATFTPVE